jgi:hypothetical protein
LAGFLPATGNLSGGDLLRLLETWLRRSISADAPAQRCHQVNEVAGNEPLLPRDRFTRALLVDELD